MHVDARSFGEHRDERGSTGAEWQGERSDSGGSREVVIMGAGPAGLTAAYELMKHNVPFTVLEKDPTRVGGIARTLEINGYRFDVGPHRFFSKSDEIEQLWTDLLGEDMLTVPRLTRILYRGKYFAYPLKAANALLGLGPIETVRCMSSYLGARLHPVQDPQTFEDWVSNQFGHRLFSIFFKTYTEKVWGISTKELSADWAAQRIKGLDLMQAIIHALIPQRTGKKGRGAVIKTLVDEFRYPRWGAGQMWERIAQLAAEDGHPVQLGQEIVAIRHRNGRVTSVVARGMDGEEREIAGTEFISTMPIRELIERCDPPLPDDVRAAAASLKYRDFVTVNVVVNRAKMFPDSWIYIHDPSVRVGRIQNYRNWSDKLLPDTKTTSLTLEYFCFEGDGIWSRSNDELVALAREELAKLKLCKPHEVLWGQAVHQHKAYPVYDDEYKAHLAVIRDGLAAQVPNLQLVGRNGMHHYNNQDHSMMTALLVARNLATGTTYDQWKVNTDAEYHEEARLEDEDTSGRLMPKRVAVGANVL
jgi:protoporphyrinogen oxidase